MKRTSARTAPGQDGLPARILEVFGKETKEQLASFFSSVIEGALILREWCLSCVVLISKKKG